MQFVCNLYAILSTMVNKCFFCFDMVKELYLYSPIFDSTAQELIAAMEECQNSGCDMTLRMNTPGGNVLSGWGIAAKLQEMTCKTLIKVDGAAMSMGAGLLPFADKVECLDVSTFMLHRADMYCETDEEKSFLANVNKNMRAKLEAKIDSAKLKELKGVTIKNLFEDAQRVDLYLTAAEAKKIGLVDKITKLTPSEVAACSSKMFAVAAIETPSTTQNKYMTAAEFKAANPELFKEITDAAIAAGIAQEKERVKPFMVYLAVDPAAVKAGVESTEPISLAQIAELSLKAASGPKLTALAAESTVTPVVATAAVVTPVVTPTAEQKELEDFTKDVKTALARK